MASTSTSASTTNTEAYDQIISLSNSLTANAHLFVNGLKDDELRATCLRALKDGFDKALSTEQTTFPHLQSLLTSLNPSSAPQTRSKSLHQLEQEEQGQARESADSIIDVELNQTPLLELTIDGMEQEMIWEQLEMRNRVVVEVLEEMFGGEQEEDGTDEQDEDENEDAQEQDDEDDDEDEDEDEDEEDEDEDEDGQDFEFDDDDDDEEETDDESLDTEDELAVERFVEVEPFEAELGKPTPGWPTKLNNKGKGVATTSQEDEVEGEVDADETQGLTLDNFDGPSVGKGPKRTGPVSAVDDDFFSLHDFHQQVDEGEAEMDKMIRGEVDSDDEANEDGEGIDLFAPVGGLKDDDDDEDDEDEEDEEDLDAAGIMYSDFFEPPPRPIGKKLKKGAVSSKKTSPTPTASKPGSSTITIVKNFVPSPTKDADSAPATPNGTKRGVKFAEKVKVKLIPPRGGRFAKLVETLGYDRAVEVFEKMQDEEEASAEGHDDEEDEEAEDDEEEDEDVEMDDEDEEEEEADENIDEDEDAEAALAEEDETMKRVSSSLFDDDDDEAEDADSPAASLSRHERRLMQLSSQIASLEAENVGVKNWATMGEAKARDRPTNSLLDEDLEFERMGKVVPVVTEETTKTIEDLIKKRILENQFDDVERRRPVDPHAFLPSRYVELQDSKSNKSLAEIYEEDYQTAKAKEAGEKVVHEMDSALEAKHQEIEDLFDDLASKLDALSNARFTPKPPKATISTITNLPSLALESALPPTQAATSMLAPEEVFVPDPTNEDRSDFTPAQKKAARQKRRKARAAVAQQVERLKESKGIKGDKEKATKMLVGQKGVTVLGKGGKELTNGKKRKRSDDDTAVPSGVRLKL